MKSREWNLQHFFVCAQSAKTWKKSILAGQSIVCHKGQNQCFLKKIRVERPQRGSGLWDEEFFSKNSDFLVFEIGIFSTF